MLADGIIGKTLFMNEHEIIARHINRLTKDIIDVERAWGLVHPKLISRLCNLAELYTALERYDEAERIYLNVLELKFRHFGANHPETLWALVDLADSFRVQEKHSEASKYYSYAVRGLINVSSSPG